MTILRDISLIWSLLHVLVVFLALFESRYSLKKTWILSGIFMGALLVVTVAVFLTLGPELTGKLMLVMMTLPSLIFYFILAKHRDGRFLFTFCLADTIAFEIIYLSNILDYYLTGESFVLMFVLRLLGFPALVWGLIRWLRRPYLELQQTVSKGWGAFAAAAAMFYLLLALMCNFPTLITARPEYLPPVLIVMVLMPCIYGCIFSALFRQMRLYQVQERQRLLEFQSTQMQSQAERTRKAQKELSIQRHDLRHRFMTLDAMLEHGQLEAARTYIASAQESLQETVIRQWCANPVLDAVFSGLFSQAEQAGIRIEADLDIPEQLPVDENHLSVVFANALENAITAVKALPESERVIRCKCIRHPQLMFRVSNPYAGEVKFDREGLPVTDEPGHGFGTRSIAAYCEKHGAYCEYKTHNGWFTIQIVQA